MDVRTALIDSVAESLESHLPIAVAEALEQESNKTNDNLSKTALILLADHARTIGVTGISELAKLLGSAVSSNDSNDVVYLAMNFKSLELSNLVDALQNAEAEKKEQCVLICNTISEILMSLGEILIESAIRSITTGAIK